MELYSLNRLPEDEAAAVEEHLLVCEECRGRLEEMDEYVAAMRIALAEVQQEAEARGAERGWRAMSRWPKPVLAVTTLAAVALAVVLTWQPGRVSPYAVSLESYRGAAPAAAAPAKTPLVLHIDTAGIPARSSYLVEIVDTQGASVLQTAAVAAESSVTADLGRALPPGQYWVRLYAPPLQPGAERELLREFGLRVD